jgi:hypothetical protein
MLYYWKSNQSTQIGSHQCKGFGDSSEDLVVKIPEDVELLSADK